MKNKVPDSHSRGLPACPLSIHCFRLLDELTDEKHYELSDQSASEEERRDRKLLEELRVHIPTCASCQLALAHARSVRAWQRGALSELVAEGELRVPSTKATIMAALHKEQQRRPQLKEVSSKPALSKQRSPRPRQRPEKFIGSRAPVVWRNVFALAAVAVFVFASLGLFARMVWLRAHTGDTPASVSSTAARLANGWSSVVIGLSTESGTTNNGRTTVTSYELISGMSTSLTPPSLPNNAQLDGISYDGLNLLYQFWQNGRVYYHTLEPLAGDGSFYSIDADEAGDAIWMPDDRHVLITTTHSGLVKADIATGATQKIDAQKIEHPIFYSDGFLYFNHGDQDASGSLFRLNLTTGAVQPVVKTLQGHSYLLSPDGKTIFYTDKDGESSTAIYAVHSDGTGATQLRKLDAAIPIGFAADNALLLLQEAGSKFQVIKLGKTSQSQDQVVLADAAPGAAALCDDSSYTPICDEDVILAPYGRFLSVIGAYSDGSRKVWVDDLQTGKTHVLLTPAPSIGVQLTGWSRIKVADTSQPAPAPGPVSFKDWHRVLFTEIDPAAGNMKIQNVDARNNNQVTLDGSDLPAKAQIDGISRDGNTLLYQYSESGITIYCILAQPGACKPFYALSDNDAGNAIWLSDNQTVFIATAYRGIIKIDTHTHESQILLPSLSVQTLEYYREPFLYFTGAGKLDANTLYRVNVTNGEMQQVTKPAPGSTFWLSPDGSAVYYSYQGSDGSSGIYAVNSDGKNLRLVSPDGIPIGYAADNGLMIMRQAGKAFQVVKLGQNARTIVADVAPGAEALCQEKLELQQWPICDNSIALAPLGGSLVVGARYADGSYKLWSLDLESGQRLHLLKATQVSGAHIQLVGWDKMPPA
ncbi:hypothetical protein EPA93_20625 [Ktedonosporobacter rubrisoli]|uniref:DUF5050 domain-containing protein n=1 Tax=Ktedonosporobacter rubrisoli TaxID=2509675 RepID=A0A4P6JSR4_KTERU|nr:hypothetical protein [Ktedonosporobacter rubrisoli]QBD78272.1 hypothetical protein EPA93_20625 [Ktedonosporobacter rubrisoli]